MAAEKSKEEIEKQERRKKEMIDAIYKHLPMWKLLAYQFWYTPSEQEVVPS